MPNANLNKAKAAKNDEFYTVIADIEREMNAYFDRDPDVFRDKTILCPCDDPTWSNFTKHFTQNFVRYGLKKLICTGYHKGAKGMKYVLEGDTDGNGKVEEADIVASEMEGDGDFRSEEVQELLGDVDFIITNPPSRSSANLSLGLWNTGKVCDYRFAERYHLQGSVPPHQGQPSMAWSHRE